MNPQVQDGGSPGRGRRDRNTSGQRGNKFNTSYRGISLIVPLTVLQYSMWRRM